MCARPRRISDEEVFAAVMRAMTRLPPSELTLAAIGVEAGVTAGALVQRFGSKRNLLLAMARAAAEVDAGQAARFLGQHRSPLKALEAFVDCLCGLAESPAAFQRNLAYLQQDLADPELHRLLALQTEGNRAAIAEMLEAARDSGELASDTNTGKLAAMIEALVVGGMMSWAFRPRGSVSSSVLALLREALKPYRAGARRSRATP